jgi:hypothetical protein
VTEYFNKQVSKSFKKSTRNGLCLNSLKTQAMVVSRHKPLNLPPVKVNGTVVPFSMKVKNLGVIMNCNFTWDDQISSIVSGVYGALNKLWCTADFTPTETRRKLAVALLLPKFQYCDILYSQSSEGNKDRLNKCYNSCARYVYNIGIRESISASAKNIIGKTLSQLHAYRICSFFYKIISQHEPGYLWDKLRFGRSQRTLNLIPPRHNYTEYGNSFFVEGANMWNSLPLEVRSARSVEAFKESYFSHTSTLR